MKKIMLALLSVLFIASSALAQSSEIPLIGSKAPSFKAMSTDGKITFPDDFGDSWKILFSHPADFTPVCSSELLELAYLQPEFEKLNVKFAVISTDNVEMHKLWVEYLEDLDYKKRGKLSIDFPLIEDPKATASKQYGMLHEPTSTNRDIRGVFIIDDKNIVRATNFYPMQVGRNMNEIVRIVEALEKVESDLVYTPANWELGDDVIVPYYPFKNEEEENDPDALQQYYKMGNRIWFKTGDGNNE
jgi:peroxiredoxin (alkyl hydroperoxide reductase subunit C)